MLRIKNNREIVMTRGDDIFIDLKIRSDVFPYNFYVLQEGDVCVMSIRKYKEGEKNPILVQSFYENDQFHIRAQDTAHLKYGTYWYDVQLTLADGTISTVIPTSPLILASEVTY